MSCWIMRSNSFSSSFLCVDDAGIRVQPWSTVDVFYGEMDQVNSRNYMMSLPWGLTFAAVYNINNGDRYSLSISALDDHYTDLFCFWDTMTLQQCGWDAMAQFTLDEALADQSIIRSWTDPFLHDPDAFTIALYLYPAYSNISLHIPIILSLILYTCTSSISYSWWT